MEMPFLPKFWTFFIPKELEPIPKDASSYWTVKHYLSQLVPGDIVYFWSSQPKICLSGWGVIAGKPEEIWNESDKISELTKTGEASPAPYQIKVDQQVWFPTCLDHRQFLDNPDLAYLLSKVDDKRIINPITTLEALSLNRLMQLSQLQTPRYPEQSSEGCLSAQALKDYEYSPSVMQTLNAALILAGSQPDLPSNSKLIYPGTLIAAMVALAVKFGKGVTTDELQFIQERSNGIEPEIISTLSSRYANASATLNDRSPEEEFLDDLNYSMVTETTLRLLAQARSLALATAGEAKIHSRHLLGALLLFSSSPEGIELAKEGASFGLDNRKLIVEYQDFAKNHFVQDNLNAWDRFLTGKGSEIPPEIAPAFFLAKVLADDTRGADLLDITPDVEAFAAVLLQSEVTPPMAVGLFGDWGSGKTFFMERLRDRVAWLAQQAKTQDSVFCQNVVQVWFNAWHYVEANLWASLVSHIFDTLQIATATDSDVEKEKLENLLAELETTNRLKREADQELAQLNKELQEAQETVANAEKEVASQAKIVSEINLKDLWQQVKLSELLDKDTSDKLTKACNDLGLSGLAASARDLHALAGEFNTLSGRVRAFALALIHAPDRWLHWLLLLFVVLLVPLVGFGVHSLMAHLDNPALVNFASKIAQLTAFFSAAGLWLRNNMQRGSDALAKLEEADRKISGSLAAARSQQAGELEEAKAALKSKQQQFDESKRQRDQLLSRKEAIEAEIRNLSPQRRILHFIKERVASEDYSRNLGLLSMIRRDFQKLSELLGRQQTAAREKDLPAIDRIILYIDDLDRCPPKRVVEVLQAIHLLLALPLFVVVVGVDARWVSRSLKNCYQDLLLEEAFGKEDGDTASSRDYLEKIFQIPFWLKPLTPDLTGNMILQVIGPANIIPGRPLEVAKESAATDVASPMDSQESPAVAQEPTSGSTPSDKPVLPLTDERTPLPKEEKVPAFQPRPPELQITSEEVEYMKTLAGITGRSPRTVKRFVNIYRLIKASQYSRLVNASNYQALMLLLALLNGEPRLAAQFINFLNDPSLAPEAKLSDLNCSQISTNLAGLQKGQALQTFSQFCNTNGREIPLKTLRDWLPDAMRNSFFRG